MRSPACRTAPPLARVRGVLAIWAGTLLLLLLPSWSGALRPLERGLAAAIAARPLPRWYFLLFILLGALLPLVLRGLQRGRGKAIQVLDPYLALLAGQLVAEGLVTRAGGIGLGVLVGMVFTLLRLWQLRQLWPIAHDPPWLRRWLCLEALLWGANAVQMAAFRWWPLAAGR